MVDEALKISIGELFPSSVFEEGGEWPTVSIEPETWPAFAERFGFDFLFCLTCIDWKTHFTMVYHLRSSTDGQILVVKAKLSRDEPEIASVAHIWRTAEFHEREVYDLFGVRFIGHPDLRRLLLPDDWTSYPLRKDFEDPINMIKL
jgi:NADH-quinone oxidoreductase subunit C